MRRRRGGDWVIGLHPYDDPVGVFALDDCPITDERVMTFGAKSLRRARISDGGRVARIRPAHDRRSRRGDRRGTRRGRRNHSSLMPCRPRRRSGGSPRTAAALSWLGGALASASFSQVNEAVGDRLHEYVLERARTHSPASVVDAYAGSGATAIPLAMTDGASSPSSSIVKRPARCAAGIAGRLATGGRRASKMRSIASCPPTSC
jgi:hypothetical protein